MPKEALYFVCENPDLAFARTPGELVVVLRGRDTLWIRLPASEVQGGDYVTVFGPNPHIPLERAFDSGPHEILRATVKSITRLVGGASNG